MDVSAALWQKSSFSGGNGGQCVEVATNLPRVIAVRDSKHQNGLALLVDPTEWQAFVSSVRRGELD
ncbi:DUF397 domain-containing protein [Sphaerisporangium aureirubrum]|uniref:DUF397 domain-containing protein n=1 Tax=Sphaerisporangium aureirubrum TaxID=1544736 RepID=A0ABW1NI48_9ACTN